MNPPRLGFDPPCLLIWMPLLWPFVTGPCKVGRDTEAGELAACRSLSAQLALSFTKWGGLLACFMEWNSPFITEHTSYFQNFEKTFMLVMPFSGYSVFIMCISQVLGTKQALHWKWFLMVTGCQPQFIMNSDLTQFVKAWKLLVSGLNTEQL
jgi:hypothetical protein